MTTNGEHGDPSDLVVAYCAPGLRGYAEALLAAKGERYRELVEHNWLAGRTDVILAADPVFPLPPFDPGLDDPPSLDRSPWANPWHDVLGDLRTLYRPRGPHPDQVINDDEPRDTWT